MPEELLGQSFKIIFSISWIGFLVATAIVLKDFWMTRIITNYMDSVVWVMLEINIPKENIKTTKSMEQVFATIYGMYSFGLRLSEVYIEGKVEPWASFEMLGTTGGIRFFVYLPENHRNLLETAFFSQYPDVEIQEAEDYTKLFPRALPNEDYEIFGTDIILARDDAYPIRTYLDFEDDTEDDQRNVDPIAVAAEVMSRLKQNEVVWLQLLVRPAGPDWLEKSNNLIESLTSPRAKKTKGRGVAAQSGEFLQNLANAPARHPEWAEQPGQQQTTFRLYTPGEQDVLKAVSRKASKRAFDTILRFVYIDKRDEFTGANIESVIGTIQQFATLDMNFFKPNVKTFTKKSTVSKFPWRREKLLEKRKKLIYQAYLNREIPHPRLPSSFRLKLQTSILNIEELASLYHPPTVAVKAPKLQPLDSKKGGPPINLPLKNKKPE